MREETSLTTPSRAHEIIDYSDRRFHVEVMRGGMNRLLLRSNIQEPWDTRIEILFMNVKYMNIGTTMNGLIIEDRGAVQEHPEALPWKVASVVDQLLFEIRADEGTGIVVAGAVAVDISDAGPSAPSNFFMM